MSDEERKVRPMPASDPFAHLLLGGPGQSEEWRARESARRKGRGRKDWFREHLSPDDPRYRPPKK